jgi:hypothetical protein
MTDFKKGLFLLSGRARTKSASAAGGILIVPLEKIGRLWYNAGARWEADVIR